jgi:hypothetical protein
MNSPSKPNQNTVSWNKPDDFLPLRRPASPRRKIRDPNWFNNPSPGQESLEDPFKAEKEAINLKSYASTMQPAPFTEEDNASNPAESTEDALSIDTSPFTIPAEVTVADTEKETTARSYSATTPRRTSSKPDDFLPLSPRHTSSKPDDFLPLRRPVRVRTAVVDIIDASAADLSLPRNATPDTTRRRSSEIVKETVVADIDDTASSSSPASYKPDAFLPSRRPDDFLGRASSPTSASPKYERRASTTQSEKARNGHARVPVEFQIDCSGMDAIAGIDIDDATIGVDAQVEQELTSTAKDLDEKGNPASSRKGDGGVNKEVQHAPVFKNKGVTRSEKKKIEWEKPNWASPRHALKATVKADVLMSEGNLARPISGISNDTGTETGISWEMPDWAKSPVLKTTDKGAALKS